MKVSTRFSVAIHILVMMNVKKDTMLTSDQLAQSVNTNPVVIRRILGMLKTAGFVDTKRGVGGSFLIKDAQDITLLDIFKAVGCVNSGSMFEIHQDTNQDCKVGANIQNIVLKNVDKAQSAMEKELSNVTIADITSDLLKEIKTQQ